jgi:hypothetical protein
VAEYFPQVIHVPSPRLGEHPQLNAFEEGENTKKLHVEAGWVAAGGMRPSQPDGLRIHGDGRAIPVNGGE